MLHSVSCEQHGNSEDASCCLPKVVEREESLLVQSHKLIIMDWWQLNWQLITALCSPPPLNNILSYATISDSLEHLGEEKQTEEHEEQHENDWYVGEGSEVRLGVPREVFPVNEVVHQISEEEGYIIHDGYFVRAALLFPGTAVWFDNGYFWRLWDFALGHFHCWRLNIGKIVEREQLGYLRLVVLVQAFNK